MALASGLPTTSSARARLRFAVASEYSRKVKVYETYNLSGQAPVTQAPTIYYTTFATLAQGASTGLINGVNGRSATTQLNGNQPLPTIMNFNLGIKHRLGTTTFEMAYVGSLNRHLPLDINLNPIPIYSVLLRQERRAYGQFPAPVSRLREHQFRTVRGHLELQLVAGFDAPPIHPRVAVRCGLYFLAEARPMEAGAK